MVLMYRLGAGNGAALMALVEAAHGYGEQADGAAWLLSIMLPSLDNR